MTHIEEHAKTFEDMIAELDAQVVSPNGYTRGELRVALDKVVDSKNWKMPITASIHQADFSMCAEAVVFFTGSVLRIVDVDEETGDLYVEAAGYYAAVGA